MTLACCTCIPHRYLIVLLSFFGMLISVGYRTSFALMVTHIAFVNSTDDNDSLSTPGDTSSIFSNCTVTGTSRDRVVYWSGSTTSLFHTAFFIGQFVMSIPAGALATKCSPKRIFGLTILMTSILQLVLPVASTYVWPIFLIRAVQGLVEAVSVPAMNAVISAWAPKSEKARLINIAYAGVYLSPAVAMFSTGATVCFVSWDSIMYIYGSLGAAWSIVFLLLVASSPASHPRLRDEEKQLLQKNGVPTNAKASTSIRAVPWCKFFTSLPVIAIWVGAFCRNFIFAILITEMQQYYRDVYQLPASLNGLLSAVPHLFMVVFMLPGSCVFDMLVKRKILNVTKTRKLAQCSGYGVQGACTLAIGFVNNHIQAFALMCVGVAFSGFAISGFQTNPLDLAPQYAAPLTGISRSGMVGAVLCTLLASQLTGHSRSLIDWQHMFIIAGCIHLAGVIFYGIFASGELQPWAKTSTTISVSQDPSGKIAEDGDVKSTKNGSVINSERKSRSHENLLDTSSGSDGGPTDRPDILETIPETSDEHGTIQRHGYGPTYGAIPASHIVP